MSPLAFHLPGDPAGVQAATLYAADAARSLDAVLVFAHGAGAGQSSPFITRYAAGLAARGVDVVTFNFPYMEARRKAPDRAPVLEDAFRRAVAGTADHGAIRGRRMFIGGKSMGGRMATHLAATPDRWPERAPGLTGAIVFGYPLRPPGGRGTDRVSHLARLASPVLIVQGTRDGFGGPDDIRQALDPVHAGQAAAATLPDVTIYPVDGGDHSLAMRKSAGRAQGDVDEAVWNAVADWIRTSEAAPRTAERVASPR